VLNESRYGGLPRACLRTAAWFIAGAALVSCSLDNRQLELAAAGAGSGGAGAGGSVGGATSASGSSSSGTPGLGGEAGAGEPAILVVDGCVDLDANRIADCTETSVNNPAFERDVAEWLPGQETTIDWNAQNAARDLPSGSALVASEGLIDASAAGVALRAVQQCIPIAGSKLVIVYGNAFVDPDQDEQGRAEINVAFFDSQDCSGAQSTTFSTPQPLDGGVGFWLTLKAGSVSGATTKSALIKLALLKPFRAESFRAKFDNVLLRVTEASP
jgi:hypothetical protein